MMSQNMALTIMIFVLGAIDTYFTAVIVPLPVWVTFIAWASFFACGGGSKGWVQSVVSNITGIIIASVTLLAIATFPQSPVVAAILVGIGSAGMVQASKAELISFTPAIVWGFASLVGTTAATGAPITEAAITHPTIVAIASMILGASFGYVHELSANALSAKAKTA